MKYIVITVLIAAGGYFYPQIAESESGPCQALEAKVVNEIRVDSAEAGLLAGMLSAVSNGELGKAIASDKYPNLPMALGCVASYYTVDPREIRI